METWNNIINAPEVAQHENRSATTDHPGLTSIREE
jgi:hypothetical protein